MCKEKKAVYEALCAALDNAQDMGLELFQSLKWDNKKAYEYALTVYLPMLVTDCDEFHLHFPDLEHSAFVREYLLFMAWIAFQPINWETVDIELEDNWKVY